MTTTNTNCEVSIPSKRFINKIKNIVGYKWCISHLNDDIIYTTLKECNMDQNETCRRLTMIHDVTEVASESSVDEVCTMLKECNMDQNETCRRLTMIHDVRKVASNYSVDDVYTMLKECNMDPSEATQRLLYIDTFQEVKKKKDTRKTASNGKTVQEVEKKKDTGKTASNGKTVQKVEKKKDTGKTASNGNTVQKIEKKKDTGKTASNGNTVQEVEKKKDTGKTVSDTVQEVEKKKDTGKTTINGNTVQEVGKKKETRKTASNGDIVQEVERKKVQEVEKKKDMQKSIGNWDNQQRRASRERENFYSSKVYNDAGRRNLTSGKEYGVTNNHVIKRVWRPKSSVDSSKESNVTHMATSAAGVNGKLAIDNKSHSHNLAPKLSSVTVVKHTIASAINTHSVSNELRLSSLKLDVMQKKLAVSSRQPVIFPDGLHVPQNCKTEFVFGSLDDTRPTKPSSRLDDRTAKSGRAT